MPSRFPPWLKRRLPASANISTTKEILNKLGLSTVCQSAICPNQGECFSRKTATFMILGNTCTRGCRFCAVEGGRPQDIDLREPERLAHAAKELGLRHVVVTSVTRDDLPDGGSGQFARVIEELKKTLPGTVIEVLTPDFGGSKENIMRVVAAGPHIYNHNVETVPRLYSEVRPEADYKRSLDLLSLVKKAEPKIFVKSGLMVGLGETKEEVHQTLIDLKECGCDIVTIGQYLQPSPNHLEVKEYMHPDVFEEYRQMGMELGFLHVASAPFVRSSFNASEFSRIYMTEGETS